MKKMMFNDRFGLTNAVIEKRKTVTRRLIACPRKAKGVEVFGYYVCSNKDGVITEIATYDADERTIDGGAIMPPYKAGEIVAIAQSYKDCGEFDVYEAPKDTAGWKNKMFVKAELMPRKIRILDVRAEKMQAITDEDCLREGVRLYEENSDKYFVRGLNEMKLSPCAISQRVGIVYEPVLFSSPREAYACLIDKISGKGTWNSNPFVWRIEFEYIN